MLEDHDFYVGAMQAAVNAGWILLPLIPAITIYRFFPDTKVAVSGPFHGLTLRAGGAFAAYLIIFLASLPLISGINQNISVMYDPQWIIRGRVIVQDENGEEVRLGRGSPPMTVGLSPDIIRLTGNRFEVIVPEINNQIPDLMIGYPGHGEYTISPMRPDPGQNVRVDRRRREIEITSPVILQAECTGIGC